MKRLATLTVHTIIDKRAHIARLTPGAARHA